jgi:mRNA interferase MazF
MQKFIKRFQEWIGLKEEIDISKYKVPSFKEGEVWMSYWGENVGHESSGKNKYFHRPVIVLRKFNKDLYYGLPMSTKNKKDSKFYIEFSFKDKQVSAMVSQLKAMSAKRLHYKMGELQKEDFNLVKKKFLALFKNKS